MRQNGEGTNFGYESFHHKRSRNKTGFHGRLFIQDDIKIKVRRNQSNEAFASNEALRAHLLTVLPAYMVPAAFVTLDALPLTPSGKLDRKALPSPEHPALAARVYVAPRTPTEEMVMAAFRDVLDRGNFGVTDNFFDLGGHSLMAMRLMSKLRAASGVDVPFRSIFERPVVAELAEFIDGLLWLANSKAPVHGTGDREEIEL